MKFHFIILVVKVCLAMKMDKIENPCSECKHMIGKLPGRCELYPNIIDDDFMDYGVRNPIRLSFTPCPIARRYETLCGRKGKRFRQRDQFKHTPN